MQYNLRVAPVSDFTSISPRAFKCKAVMGFEQGFDRHNQRTQVTGSHLRDLYPGGWNRLEYCLIWVASRYAFLVIF